MYTKHQTAAKGDMSFIESLLPESVKVQHVDSYNTERSKRFQGCFMYDFGTGRTSACNEAPLDILKMAKNYQTYICTQCGDNPHIVWTIWF
jgi:hypothetical protein